MPCFRNAALNAWAYASLDYLKDATGIKGLRAPPPRCAGPLSLSSPRRTRAPPAPPRAPAPPAPAPPRPRPSRSRRGGRRMVCGCRECRDEAASAETHLLEYGCDGGRARGGRGAGAGRARDMQSRHAGRGTRQGLVPAKRVEPIGAVETEPTGRCSRLALIPLLPTRCSPRHGCHRITAARPAGSSRPRATMCDQGVTRARPECGEVCGPSDKS